MKGAVEEKMKYKVERDERRVKEKGGYDRR